MGDVVVPGRHPGRRRGPDRGPDGSESESTGRSDAHAVHGSITMSRIISTSCSSGMARSPRTPWTDGPSSWSGQGADLLGARGTYPDCWVGSGA